MRPCQSWTQCRHPSRPHAAWPGPCAAGCNATLHVRHANGAASTTRPAPAQRGSSPVASTPTAARATNRRAFTPAARLPSPAAPAAAPSSPPSASRGPPRKPPPEPPTLITSLPDHLRPSILSNALLLVDKPPHWEVQEVIAAVQRATRAAKLASLAPLDAAASGLLLLAFGAATRLAPAVERAAKRYEGSMVLGAAAGSGDARGASLMADALPWGHVTDEELQEVADSLVTQAPVATGRGAGHGAGNGAGGDGGGGPAAALQLLPLRYRLRQLPSSFNYIEEDVGASMVTTPMQLREFRVWRQEGPEGAAVPLAGRPAPGRHTRNSLAVSSASLGAGGSGNSSSSTLRSGAGGGSFSSGTLGSSNSTAGGGGTGGSIGSGGGGERNSQAGGGGIGGGGGGGGRVLRFSALVAGRTQLRPLVSLYGRRLRSSAVLDELRRTGVGSFALDDAWALESLLPLLERYRGWWSERPDRR